jgi:hypothetical protein
MTNIQEQFSEIEATKLQIGAVAFFSDKYKKTREWQVLGAVQSLLLAAGEQAPVYADESESPDFITFNAAGEPWFNAEIVEILLPGYRRHLFHKKDAKLKPQRSYDIEPPMADPWSPLRETIKRKAEKRYGRAIALLVYYDIGRFAFRDWTRPFNEQLLAAHAAEPFVGVGKFDRVLILNCDMRSLVELQQGYNSGGRRSFSRVVCITDAL